MRWSRLVLTLAVACSAKAPPGPHVPPHPAGSAAPAPIDAARPVDAPPPDAPPDARLCPPQNPKGCPAAEPNVNHPCSVKGAECVYDSACCHQITYVCAKNLHFEAHIQRCP